jgi:hypothetical protein
MKRRIAIRNLVLLSAGAALLDACGTKEAMGYKNIPLTDNQSDLLSQLSEMIIPATPDFVGAKDLKSSEFTLMMIDDCAGPDDQAAFLDGLQKFDEACKSVTGSTFIAGTNEQRTAFLSSLEGKPGEDRPDNVVKFYRAVKRSTIQSFMSSQEYLTKVRNFSLIPPKFQGCVPVETV